MKGIHIRVSEDIISQLKEIKGEGPWIELLLDGAKYRGYNYRFNALYSTIMKLIIIALTAKNGIYMRTVSMELHGRG